MAVRLLLLAIVAAVSFGALAVYVNSATANDPAKFIVDDSLDLPDFNPGDGVCDTSAAGPPVDCTFRAALDESNALAGPNVINFTVSNTSTLAANGPPYVIQERVTIDASANPGGFNIDATGSGGDGLTLGSGSSGSVIRGLDIENAPAGFSNLVICGGASSTIGGDPDAGVAPSGEGNAFRGAATGDGIEIVGGPLALPCDPAGSLGGHTIVGNKIGTEADGLTADGNGSSGINITGGIGADITIGGFPNLISDHGAGVGIDVAGGSADVIIQNNWIGLDANGNATDAFANLDGIHLHTDGNTVWNNRIAGGGVDPSNNPGFAGIFINANDNTIRGNCIGFDSDCDGTAGGFLLNGIDCTDGNDNIIGDGTDEGRNVIGNTDFTAVDLLTCDGNDFNGNYVGFGMDGEEGAPVAADCLLLTDSDDNQIRNSYIGNCGLVGINLLSGTGNSVGGPKVAAGDDNDGNDLGRGTDPATPDDINGFCIELAGVGGHTVRNNVMANCDVNATPDASIMITAGNLNVVQGNDITSPEDADAVAIEAPAQPGLNNGNLIASRIFRMVNASTGALPIDLDNDQVTINDAGDADPGTPTATCGAAESAN
ncbi:MAG: hypothetical protein IIC90_12455, partial [Chloroflexi bacterium]|nr:hypothetical protein [Chloroflexota bacterium]